MAKIAVLEPPGELAESCEMNAPSQLHQHAEHTAPGQQDQHRPVRVEHSRQFGERRSGIGQVLDDMRRNHDVEAGVGEWQAPEVATRQRGIDTRRAQPADAACSMRGDASSR